jgi:hypothetical protein
MSIKIVFDVRVLTALETIAAESVKQTELLTDIRDVMRRAIPPHSARNLQFHLLKEIEVDKIIFSLSADAPDPDVKTRELTLTLNPGTSEEALLTKVTGDASTVEFTKDSDGNDLGGPQDAFVKASLVDIDDGGNPADPTEITFQLLDTFPPVSATGLGVKFVREDQVPDPPAPTP